MKKKDYVLRGGENSDEFTIGKELVAILNDLMPS